MARPIHLALAGISGYGDCYLDALLNDPRAAHIRLVAAADPHLTRSRHLDPLRGRDVPVYESAAALFARHPVDLFCIAAPIHAHASLTCLALRHGASVLCEKPVAATLADALRMRDAERESRGFVAVGFQWSFSAAVRSLKRDVLAGALGRPLRLASLAYFPRSHSYFSRNDWAGRLRSPAGQPVFDSPVNNATAHYLHNLFFLLGPTPATSAMPLAIRAELYRANPIETFDTAALHCTLPGAVDAMFYTTHAVPDRRGPLCRFEFEHATVHYHPDADNGHFVARFHDGRTKSYGPPNIDPFEKLWHSVDSLHTGEPPACGIPAALPHAATVAALHRGAVAVTEFPPELKRLAPSPNAQPMTTIAGLAETFAACYDAGTLPAESGHLPWAPPPITVPVRPPDPDRAASPVAATAPA